MNQCNLDHSLADVQKKLAEQSTFLPTDILQRIEQLLEKEQEQATLNEIFHLLKKYDLASPVEQRERDEKINKLISSLS